MAIEFKCECGKTLSVPDEVAGHTAKCPSCGKVTTVPGEVVDESAPAESSVDRVVGNVRDSIAKSRERAPQLTVYAIGLAGWSFIYLVFSFVFAIIAGGSYGWVMFLLVWLPVAAYGGLAAYSIIIAHRLVPACIELFAPVILGISYVQFWMFVLGAQGWGVLMLLLTILNIAVYVLLFLYFRKPEIKTLFAAEPAAAVTAEAEAAEPAAPAPASSQETPSQEPPSQEPPAAPQ